MLLRFDIFIDIRPTKVLIEYYNKEDKSYSMKHVQEQRSMLCFSLLFVFEYLSHNFLHLATSI